MLPLDAPPALPLPKGWKPWYRYARGWRTVCEDGCCVGIVYPRPDSDPAHAEAVGVSLAMGPQECNLVAAPGLLADAWLRCLWALGGVNEDAAAARAYLDEQGIPSSFIRQRRDELRQVAALQDISIGQWRRLDEELRALLIADLEREGSVQLRGGVLRWRTPEAGVICPKLLS